MRRAARPPVQSCRPRDRELRPTQRLSLRRRLCAARSRHHNKFFRQIKKSPLPNLNSLVY